MPGCIKSKPEPLVSPPDFSFGDIVRDREDDDPNEAVVVNTPPMTAEEWEVYEKWDGSTVTVADDNPDYPEDAAVVVVVYRDDLDETFPDWPGRENAIPIKELNEANVPHYSFPAPRLTHVDQEPAAPEPDAEEAVEDTGDQALEDGIVAMHDLKARLADANWEIEVADGMLTVTKLGETYSIHPNGTVEGEGNIREPLEHTVDEYIDSD